MKATAHNNRACSNINSKSEILKSYSLLNALGSFVTLIVLLFDYTYINEFKIEDAFLLIATTFIIVNLGRQIFPKVWLNRPLGIVSNIVIGLSSLIGFYVLTINFFGYGFSGRQIQTIWVLMAICNFSLFILTLFDIRKIWLLNK